MRQEQNSFWIFESIVSAPGALSWSSFAQPETVLRTNKLFLPVADWVQLQRASTATGCQNILAMSVDVEPLTTIHHNSPQFTTRLSNSTWQWWVQPFQASRPAARWPSFCRTVPSSLCTSLNQSQSLLWHLLSPWQCDLAQRLWMLKILSGLSGADFVTLNANPLAICKVGAPCKAEAISVYVPRSSDQQTLQKSCWSEGSASSNCSPVWRKIWFAWVWFIFGKEMAKHQVSRWFHAAAYELHFSSELVRNLNLGANPTGGMITEITAFPTGG